MSIVMRRLVGAGLIVVALLDLFFVVGLGAYLWLFGALGWALETYRLGGPVGNSPDQGEILNSARNIREITSAFDAATWLIFGGLAAFLVLIGAGLWQIQKAGRKEGELKGPKTNGL